MFPPTANLLLLASYNKPPSVFGPKSPVADSNKPTKQVESVVAATVIAVGVPPPPPALASTYALIDCCVAKEVALSEDISSSSLTCVIPSNKLSSAAVDVTAVPFIFKPEVGTSILSANTNVSALWSQVN